jgi:hypothetical protein
MQRYPFVVRLPSTRSAPLDLAASGAGDRLSPRAAFFAIGGMSLGLWLLIAWTVLAIFG